MAIANGAPARTYALVKVAAGDWLLPSNDARTLWRLQRYEDGPSHGLDPEVFPTDFEAWQLWRYKRPLAAALWREDVEDWDQWTLVATNLETRGEAIDEAMRIGEGS